MFEGIYTALITPFSGGEVDREGLERIIERQLEAGVHGLVVCATTGEGSVLRDTERELVIRTAVERAAGKAQVIVGTGRVSTWASLDDSKIAAELGADAALVVSPAYVKPSQEGMITHYEELADGAGIPIIVYNVPTRTACDLLPATMGRLAAHEKIVGIKEATGSILRTQQVIAAVDGKCAVLSGDDPVTLSLLVAGGQGVICTASNVVPDRWVALWKAWKEGNIERAARIQNQLVGLHEAIFLETNPGPVKAAVHLLGLIEPEIRLPLTWPNPQTLFRLAEQLERLGLTPQGVA